MTKKIKDNFRREARRVCKASSLTIPKGFHVHHIDGDVSNNNLSNLKICSPEEHWKIHESQGDIQFLSGKFVQGASAAGKIGGSRSGYKMSEEGRKNIGIASSRISDETRRKRSVSIKSRWKNNPTHKMKTLGRRVGAKLKGVKKSGNHVLKMSLAMTGRFSKRNNPNWKGFWITPSGNFETVKEASNHFGVSGSTIMRRCLKNHPFYTIEKFSEWGFIPC